MPSAHLNFLRHIGFGWFFLVLLGAGILCHDFLALIGPVRADILATLVHELHINLAIGLVLDINDMNICIIASGKNHARIR